VRRWARGPHHAMAWPGVKVHFASYVVLVINDNLYGLMFSIEFDMKEPSIDNV
jgi:hypothetical protein